jgi:hypothetical protein
VDFVLAASEGVVSIDNQPLGVDVTGLPANVALVAYDCTQGSGSIEYTDRLRLLEPVIDLTPYQPFVNKWMTAAAALTTMRLTLAQAKRVKLGLVDGIYNSKRQAPITSLGYTWDATDPSLIGMQTTIDSWDIVAAVSNNDNSIVDQVNGMGISTSIAGRYYTYTAAPSFSISNWDSNYVNANYYVYLPAPPSAYFVYNVGVPISTTSDAGSTASSQIITSITAGSVTGPTVYWPAMNTPTPIAMAMTDMRALISSIQARRTNLQAVRSNKQAYINAQITIAPIIAYDATAGWPY